jgi:hypothetical protein
VIAVALLCCVGTVVAGVLAFRFVEDNVSTIEQELTSEIEQYTEKHGSDIIDELGDLGGGSGGWDEADISAPAKGTVLVNSSDVTITLGNSTVDEYLSWYEIEVTVENRTDGELVFFFESLTNASGASLDAFIYPVDFDLESFSPNKTTKGMLTFDVLPEDGDLRSLRGVLVAYDWETYETIAEYEFNLSAI